MIPQTEEQLMHRVNTICGMTINELANQLRIPIPNDFKRAKGFAGQIIELALGATAGSKPIQDFPNLGIELKTIPINKYGLPSETTHVCIIQQDKICGQCFENSNFLNKIKKVLWLPIEGDKDINYSERHIGQGFLWTLKGEEYNNLKTDWEEIMEEISVNGIEQISAKLGVYMQVRPAGKINNVKQYGFYLRKEFTTPIIQKFFANLQ